MRDLATKAGVGARGLAAALCASVLILLVAAAPAAADPAERALERAEVALSERPEAAQAPPERDVSFELLRLANALPRLDGEERMRARALLARPDDGGADRFGDGYTVPEADESPHCTANFCVHWVAEGRDAPDPADENGTDDGDGIPDYVEDVGIAAEQSYQRQNGDLGWTEPLDDDRGADAPGDVDKVDVYLVDIGDFYFGYASPDIGQGQTTSKHGYLVLDDDYAKAQFGFDDPLVPMRVTMAHEYNHILQFVYDTDQDLWMFESTATYMEDVVFPDIDDYVGYVAFFARSPGTPITSPGGGSGLAIYGAAVWNHYLARTLDEGDLDVRDAWAVSDQHQHFAVAAYDAVIEADPDGESFSRSFGEFAVATAEWRKEWKDDPQAAPFPDATEYRNVKRRGKLKVGDTAKRFKLDHTAYRLLRVKGSSGRAPIRLKVRVQKGTWATVALVGLRHDGSVQSGLPVHVKGGVAKVAASAPGSYKRLTAVIVNSDGRAKLDGGSPRYKRDDRRFRARIVARG